MNESVTAEQVIGHRFEIGDKSVDLIGRGGMGDVYRGYDRQSGKTVAIKVLKPDLLDNDGEFIARFIREGEALRQLNHPNIVSIIDMVEEMNTPAKNPTYFLIMEYVEGGSLRDLLREKGRLRPESLLEIGLDLADALTRAHRLGIIHRDLKPGNVLLSREGTPRLTDFGLAHMADGASLTKAGVLIGTIDYLSPEACSGLPLDERADIWSFGVLLWELLAGRPPFRRDNIGATLAAILTDPPANIREFCPEASQDLVNLFDRMLEKDPALRVPSMRIVGAELERILRGDHGAPAESWSQAQPGPIGDKSEATTPVVGRQLVDTWSAHQTLLLLIARSKERGDQFLGQPSLAFAYSVQDELELDDESAALMLRSALYHDEPVDPWLSAFASGQATGQALRSYYDSYPRPEIRQRIVMALAEVAEEEASSTLLHIAAHDDAAQVRTAAALESSRRGYREVVMAQALAQAQKDGDPSSLATLAALVDRYGLPEGSGNLLKIQVTLALARQRWKSHRKAIWRQARRVALAGTLLALYGASTPLQMIRTDPDSYQHNINNAGLPAWIFVLVIFFALYGVLQGLACGFFPGLADALWIGGPRRVGRFVWSSPAGLVYALIMGLFLGLQPEELPTSPAVFLLATLLFGLLLGMLLSLVVPTLGTKRARSDQLVAIVVVALLGVAANIPYLFFVFRELDSYVFLSRSLLIGLLPLVMGLPFLLGRAERDRTPTTSERS